MEQTFIIKYSNGDKIIHTNTILKREQIGKCYFLEFGKHKEGNYEYIAVLKGDIKYYGKDSSKSQEVYFAFKKHNQWRILDATRIGLVEDFKKKVDAVNRLRSLISPK